MQRVLVLGFGVSGKASVAWLRSKGYQVDVVDRIPQEGVFLDSAPLELSAYAFVVASPGWSPQHPLYAGALALGIEVIGEAELAFRHWKKKAVAVTGTNGKTTVTLLCTHVLNCSGIKSASLGNIGKPLLSCVLEEGDEEVCVVELSSYQLETMTTPVFEAGVVLNITPDHLDRYPTMEAYAEAKWRLKRCIMPKREGSFYVQERAFREYGQGIDGVTLFGFSSTAHFWIDKQAMWEGKKKLVDLPERYAYLGAHERENLLAAYLLCRTFGVHAHEFLKAAETFRKPAHRIEFVKTLHGVSYFDDSKGTNIDAVIQAVGCMQGKVVLIAGGVDKGSSYAAWRIPFQDKVKKIIAIGQAAEKICGELADHFKIEVVPSLAAAVQRAKESAEEGENVLLSPGCASYDMFRDYAHRGEEFQRIVYHLEE